ncbi:hypothetical protein FRC01_003878 [Tulasnella sp. 417]|nr:hypothetical protein FRC01_003878 [Tulasnella sp. 417]
MATITRRQSQDETLKRTRSIPFKNLPFAEVHLTSASTKQQQHPSTTTVNHRNRPVLLPIHTNIRPIRRLPSRSRMHSAFFNRTPRSGSSYASSPRSPAVDAMDEDSQTSGRKRKRGTGNENIDSNGGGLVNKSPLKRSKSAYASLGKGRAPSNRDMAVDEPPARRATVVVESSPEEPEQVPEEDEETEPEDGPIDSSDDHYVSEAPPWQLRRLKKEDLLRIYGLAGLSSVGDVGEDLTKTDLITAILRAVCIPSLQSDTYPTLTTYKKQRKNSKGSASSPRTRTASTHSPPSSAANTDGNDGGAEESDVFDDDDDGKRARKLRRSATTHANLTSGLPTNQLKKSRSINFREVNGQLEEGESSSRRTRFAADQRKGVDGRRRTSGQASRRSSPSSPGPSAENGFYSAKNQSPRHTRLRQSSKTLLDPKGKGKHVEFSDDQDGTEDESQLSTADEADNPKDEDWEDEEATPRKSRMPRDREMATPTKLSGAFKRQASLTRNQSKMRVFSPKKLRSRTSKTNLASDGDAGASTNPLRRSSSSRRNMTRKVKPSRSLREPDSEDDNRDFPADEDVIEESQDEEVDELMDEDTQPTVQATQPEDESSDLTELSSGESDLTEMSDEDDNYGEQAEESPAPEETPKPARTRTRSASNSKRSEGSSRSRKRSGPEIAAVALPLTRRASRRKLKSPTPEVEEEAEEDEVLESAADDDAEVETRDEEAEEEEEAEVEPRVLRNGKVVGAADEEEEEEDQIDEDESTEEAEAMDEDGDAEVVDGAVDEDEDMEGDFDLTEATAKSLIKLRRDDLVRLCEARDLEPEGTKTQLVSNLLQWRDQVAQAPSSSTQPSSRASTVRAPSTYRGQQNDGSPVLLRSNRIHLGISIPEDTKTTPVMMVSELCTNGDLFDYIRNEKPPTLRKLLNLMLDIARGLDYLHNIHKPSVIHRDCKSSNILITGKVTAKIADFGLAKVKQSTRSMVKSLVGTVNWQAPELWHAHPKYDHKVDVFSCAMVFWEMLQWHNPSKKYPWEGMNEHAIYEEVGAKKNRPSLTGCRKQWCPEIVDLVMRMWAQDPKQRPPIREVVEELESIIANL